jgi:uncharacterized membrane protein
MKARYFLSRIEHREIHEAIRAAEEGTSGDIVLYITHRRMADALAAAHQAFKKSCRKKPETSLLIFVSPLAHTFAIVGGDAVHDKMGQPWWESLTGILESRFKSEQFTTGLIEVIAEMGSALKNNFPAPTTDRRGERDIVED